MPQTSDRFNIRDFMSDQVPDTNGNGDSWKECRKLVITEISRLGDNDDEQWDAIKKHDVDIAVIKVKAGIWGALGALVPILIALVIFLIQKFAIG